MNSQRFRPSSPARAERDVAAEMLRDVALPDRRITVGVD